VRSPNKKKSQIWRRNIQSNTEIIVRRDYVFLIGTFCRGSDSEIRVENLWYDFWVEESRWVWNREWWVWFDEIRMNVSRLITIVQNKVFGYIGFVFFFWYGGYICVCKWTWPLFQI
jgi:hypothetical protein